MRAYLDIETSFERRITIIGIFREEENRVIQLFEKSISLLNLKKSLKGISTLYTYNGKRFDIPIIERELSCDMSSMIEHEDLMHACWANNLYGGLKEVEKKLGIKRDLTGVDGYYAMVLWKNFIDFNDKDSLEMLLKYNREDVVNLSHLRKILNRSCSK